MFLVWFDKAAPGFFDRRWMDLKKIFLFFSHRHLLIASHLAPKTGIRVVDSTTFRLQYRYDIRSTNVRADTYVRTDLSAAP